jgi:hypothetical protein
MGVANGKTRFAWVLATTAVGCGDGSGRGEDDGSASASASITVTVTDDGTGSASADDTSASSVDGDSTQASVDGSEVDGSDDGPKFDVGTTPDAGIEECGGKGGGPEFSYIWIANTAQGTISKLDTQTMVEAGRYQTRPDANGSPSRTSVSLSGDVAVANRNGGVTKVYAREEDCVDDNGTAGLQTSTGKDDILAWDEEECVAWHTPMAYATQRPVAWTSGTYQDATCSWSDQKLWTAGANANGIDVLLLDGDTGVIEDMVNVPVAIDGFGAYGGAVDEDGDFWFMTYVFAAPLVEVDLATMTYSIGNMPSEVHPYGITVDQAGRIWIGADVGTSARYTPATNTWDLVPGNVTGLGIQEHPDGYMWMGTFPTTGIQAIDVETLALGPFIPLASPSQTKGVSIDFYGYVWLVDMTNSAWRIDPGTLDYDVYTGLDSPYTYSDMTGWGLANVTGPQG